MRRSGEAHGVPEPCGNRTQGPHMCVNTMGKEPGAVVIPLKALTLRFPPPQEGETANPDSAHAALRPSPRHHR